VTEPVAIHQPVDPNRQQKLDAGLRPFKLVTYFSFSSLAVILLFTLILSWAISNNARRVMLKQSEEYSMLLAENLNQQVFRRFVLPAVVRYGNIALSNPEQFEMLDKIVRGIIQGMKIDAVTIYDSSVNIISYSTVSATVGKKDAGGNEYKKSLQGEANSKLTYSGTVFNLFPGTRPLRCELQTYIPFRQVREGGEDDGVIMGVIAIDKDLSSEYANILRLQGSIILVSGFVSMILFLVLRTIVSRAGRIMENRAVERLRLEEKLNQTERLAHLGTMVATVSHEIKSPLGIVRSTAEILEKRIQKVAPGNEHLARIIVDETIRLNDIVVGFLDFAKPQKPKFVKANINQLVTRVLSFLSSQVKAQQIELVTEFAADIPDTDIDQELLYRALLNILLNGLQAMGEGGKLLVATENCSEAGLRIRITDTGGGMPAEKLEQIFKPFFTDKHKGTGLGLAITKNIIESHHGSIHVHSMPGEGTTFTITLPSATVRTSS
jgi:two-component system, NtrC family, sensor histidine kinase HydH